MECRRLVEPWPGLATREASGRSVHTLAPNVDSGSAKKVASKFAEIGLHGFEEEPDSKLSAVKGNDAALKHFAIN